MSKSYRMIDPLVLLAATGGDQELFHSLSLTFLDTAPALLARLDQACGAGALAPVVHACHTLRGTTVLLGAHEISTLLAELERQARRGELPGAAALQRVAQLFALTCEEVRHSIAGHGGAVR